MFIFFQHNIAKLVLITGLLLCWVLIFLEVDSWEKSVIIYPARRKDDFEINTLDPPQLLDHEKALLEDVLKLKGKETEQSILETVSKIVQSQLKRIQSPNDCSTAKTLLCGHFDGGCGFGCQLHHRVACLMISYAMNLPLIHDSENGWFYKTPWNEILRPLGSDCVPGSNTFRWTWDQKRNWSLNNVRHIPSDFNVHWDVMNQTKLDSPLDSGIVAARKLADIVNGQTQSPHLWWVGQFMKYALQLNSVTEDRIRKDKALIGIKSNCIGFHVRRTDKAKEYADSFHDLKEYFTVAKKLFNLEKHEIETNETMIIPPRPQIYIASDDPMVFKEAELRFPAWEMIGFQSSLISNRSDSLYEILRDVMLLSECKSIVCGLSSNVCRLLLEILSYKDHDNFDSRIKPVDGRYFYVLYRYGIVPAIRVVERLELGYTTSVQSS